YYLRIVKLIYFDQPKEGAFTMVMDLPARAILTVAGVIILYWGIFPGALLAWSAAGP
ncbi:MAG: NADH:ubiquinone oxidoreductase subunit N, partial [Magnetococcales bacterium]|nr:NADH:ubiquinone oxidoreductase subunit N [Magnetococcales bacterium]